MLAIKLQRIGKKHQPSYRLVVAEGRSKMAAPPVEDLGAYNPFVKTATFNKERVLYWIKVGAQPTLTVHNLLVDQQVLSAKKLTVKMKKAMPATTVVETPKVAVAELAAEPTAESVAEPEAVAPSAA